MATLLSDENKESFGLILNKKELAYLIQCVRRFSLVDTDDPVWDAINQVLLPIDDSDIYDLVLDEWVSKGRFIEQEVVFPSGWTWED